MADWSPEYAWHDAALRRFDIRGMTWQQHQHRKTTEASARCGGPLHHERGLSAEALAQGKDFVPDLPQAHFPTGGTTFQISHG